MSSEAKRDGEAVRRLVKELRDSAMGCRARIAPGVVGVRVLEVDLTRGALHPVARQRVYRAPPMAFVRLI